MKKKQSKFLILVAALIAGFAVVYFYSRKDVEISHIQWKCETKPCIVNFQVENKTNRYITCKISIRAVRDGGKKTFVSTKGFAGEKTIDINISPRNDMKIREPLKTLGHFRTIQVQAWAIVKHGKAP